MGWNDRMDAWFTTDVPQDAIAFSDGHLLEIDDRWFKNADPDEQVQAMKAWFLGRFCDPANETPYNGAEGGYLYVNGGPYHPNQVLHERFGNVADSGAIQEVADELQLQVGDDWALIDHGFDDYDDEFGVEVEDKKDPISDLEQRLNAIKGVLTLTGPSDAVALTKQLAFSSVIAALETFLWETMTYAVENDERVVRNVITKIPFFKDQGMKLGEIFDKHEGLKGMVKQYLQNTVWHKEDSVSALIKYGLRIDPPSLKKFRAAIVKRHDIVHRSGHTKEGLPITVEAREVCDLIDQVKDFADELDYAVMNLYLDESQAEIASSQAKLEAEFAKLDELIEKTQE